MAGSKLVGKGGVAEMLGRPRKSFLDDRRHFLPCNPRQQHRHDHGPERARTCRHHYRIFSTIQLFAPSHDISRSEHLFFSVVVRSLFLGRKPVQPQSFLLFSRFHQPSADHNCHFCHPRSFRLSGMKAHLQIRCDVSGLRPPTLFSCDRSTSTSLARQSQLTVIQQERKQTVISLQCIL